MIEELKWDSEFFGRKIGRLTGRIDEDLGGQISRAAEQGFRYLFCRLSSAEISAAQILEGHGFYLTDIGIVWERDLEMIGVPGIPAESGAPRDYEYISGFIPGLFRESRFYRDKFFSNEEADRFYQAWVKNSLNGLADKVFLIRGKGFITCKITGDSGNIPLVGVSAACRGQGIGKSLMLNALQWFGKNRVKKVTVKTQSGNIGAVRFYASMGFTVGTVDITMGKILG